MKQQFLLCAIVPSAQTNPTLKPVAELLFKNVKTKLAMPEKNGIASYI